MAKNSLWGLAEPVEIVQNSDETAQKIKNKIDNAKTVEVKKVIKSTKIPLEDKLKIIAADVHRILGKYEKDTQIIKTKEELVAYIDKAIENGEIAVDTETNNSLDPITCKIMGGCIYTPGLKNAYIPINHVDIRTKKRLDWQLTEDDLKEQFDRLKNTKIIMHNGKFDYQVIKCTCNSVLSIYWDTLVGARLLNENERAGLKEQYRDKIDMNQEKYDIEHLFRGLEYAIIDPELFALYAATDSKITYELYKWQVNEFNKPGHERLLWLFNNVEMPVVEVTAEMELTGITIDKEYAKLLSKRYHSELDKIQAEIDAELVKIQPDIDKWRSTSEANYHEVNEKGRALSELRGYIGERLIETDGLYYVNDITYRQYNNSYKFKKSKSEQLENPPSVASPTQLAILLYDVLKVKVVDKKSPRGTGEDILKEIDNPICSLILKLRGINKLINTYVDKLPECVCEKDGRLHAHFNQLGTDTGRFSSTDPNLQNIPSHNKNIRMMFVPQDGYSMIGSDFSQQEPRLLSCLSQDKNMIKAYQEGKDLYATIGTGVYHNDYWDNMEKHQDGSPNPDGKKRRSNMKVLLLGIMYGMGPASIASDIGCSVEEANEILENFYKGFPSVKTWKDETEKFAKTNGYVEDLWGRRRRLPDLFLPKYEIKVKNETFNSDNFNPLLGSVGKIKKEKPKQMIKYEKLLAECKGYKDAEKVKNEALKEGVTIIDHGAHISQAERQCVNARVQGSAATMSKIALRRVYDNKELNDLGFKVLLQIHDEFIGECPVENAERASELLAEVMKTSVKDYVNVPFKCDAEVTPRWYYDEYTANIANDYRKLMDKGMTAETAKAKILADNPEASIFNWEELIK